MEHRVLKAPFHGSICVPYRSVTNPGIIDAWSDEFLYDREGVYGSGGTFFPNADTYSFQVQGYRSDIELIVIGSCGADIPNRILTEAEVTDFRGTPTFNGSCRASYGLLVSKDCNPNNPDCPAIAHVNSTGNAYYRIENPSAQPILCPLLGMVAHWRILIISYWYGVTNVKFF